MWQADNNDRHNRKRFSGVTRKAVLDAVDKWIEEREKHGTDHALAPDAREAALRALRTLGDRATLDEIVAFWKDRHPSDGGKNTLEDMADQFLANRQGQRPATIRATRQKMTTFTAAIGGDTPVAAIGEEDIKQFMQKQKDTWESQIAWKKVLGAFFTYCMERQDRPIKTNPVTKHCLAIAKPKPFDRQPTIWTPRDVETFMRIAEHEEPDMVAAFAVLWWAGLRPTEVAGQYRLEHEKISAAKATLAQARTNFEAEKMRLGLVRGRGSDTARQAANRATLEGSAQAVALADALDHLSKMQEKHGGEAMQGLTWADICLDDDEEKFIRVRAETSKVLKTRNVDILPGLAVWLMKYRKVGGPLVVNPTAFRRARDRILAQMPDAKWTADVCRHTFASYHYKKHGNRDKLAEMLGHTDQSKQIERHYKNPAVSRADAEKFWAIVPEGMELNKSKQAERIRA